MNILALNLLILYVELIFLHFSAEMQPLYKEL